MSDSLLPCPFCGGSNMMTLPPTCNLRSKYNPADRAFPIVKCMGCYAEASGENWDEKGKSAVEAWNRRTPPKITGGE